MRMVAWILFLIVNIAVAGMLSTLNHGLDVLGNYLIAGLLSFVAIVIHELGHAVAVRGVGGRVGAIVAMPFELRLRPLRLKLAGRSVPGDIGGYVSYTLGGGATRHNRAIIAAAGPAANFLLALLAAALAGWFASEWVPGGTHRPGGLLPSDAEIADYLVRYQHYRAATAIGTLCNALAILSAGMGLANLIPFAGSDGATLVRALRPRPR